MVREDSISYLRIDKERSQEWPSVAQPYVSAAPSGLMGYSRSRRPPSMFVSTSSCAPRVFRRASQGPQDRVVPFGGARQGPDRRLRTAVSSADRAESLGL